MNLAAGEGETMRTLLLFDSAKGAGQGYPREQCFRALIENGSDAISLTTPSGEILYASPSSARVLGYQPEELVGRNEFDLVHPDDIPVVKDIVQEVLDTPWQIKNAEARVRRKSGRWCWMDCTGSNLLHEPDVRAIALSLRDISRRKDAEDRERREAEELARCNTDLKSFAYGVTHDLKEPLRTIRAFTELLTRTAPLDDKSQNCAGFIVEGVGRMTALLDNLQSLTALEFGDATRRVELNQVLFQALQNLEQAIQESGAVISADPLPAVRGNEGHLLQLFQNLLGNAIKYRSEAALSIHVGTAPLGREWLITVKDNGIGIAAEYHDQVFGLFKRLHDRTIPGSGIGLTICKQTVERMGGRIWVESEPGKGSTFCFTVAGLQSDA